MIKVVVEIKCLRRNNLMKEGCILLLVRVGFIMIIKFRWYLREVESCIEYVVRNRINRDVGMTKNVWIDFLIYFSDIYYYKCYI